MAQLIGRSPRSLAAPRPVGQQAARGFIWTLLQTLGSKTVNVASQIVLAWLLEPAHFGLVSMAYTVSSLANVIQQAGLREVLIQRQDHAQRWSNPAFWMALGFGALASAVMVAAAPLAASAYGAPQVKGMVWILATWPPLNALANVPLAHLQASLRFRLVTLITFGASSFQWVLTIFFALLGFGAYSFVLPWPLVGIARLAALWIAARPPIRLNPQWRRWRYLLTGSLLVLGADACGTLIKQGDYIVLSLFHEDTVVGQYYFAFTLAIQALVIFSFNLQGILLPALSTLQNDPARQRQAFLSACRLLLLLGIPACLLQAALAEPLMLAIFKPKWAPAIPVVQILSVGMALRLAGWPSQSLLQAQGRFRLYLGINAVGVSLFMLLVTLAARTSPAHAAHAVALAATAYFALEGPLNLFLAIRPAGGKWRDVGGVYAPPLLAAALAAGLAVFLAGKLPAMPARHWVRAAVILLVLAGVYAPLIYLLAPEVCRDGLNRFNALRARSSAAA